jgi:hypothetical protein
MVEKPASRSRPPKLLDQMREALLSRHYSRRTEQTYCQWVKRYIHFHHVRHPAEMAEPEINTFLTHVAVKENVSASTQNQALSALLFLLAPQESRWKNEKTGEEGRHHVHESIIQKAVNGAVR